jgi:hypothetical protein
MAKTPVISLPDGKVFIVSVILAFGGLLLIKKHRRTVLL